MKRQITFILLIALTIAIPWNAWGEEKLYDFASSTTLNEFTYTQGNTNDEWGVKTVKANNIEVRDGGFLQYKNAASNTIATFVTKESFNNITKISFYIASTDKAKTQVKIEICPNADFSADITEVVNTTTNGLEGLGVTNPSNKVWYLVTQSVSPVSGYVRFSMTASSSGKFWSYDDIKITYANEIVAVTGVGLEPTLTLTEGEEETLVATVAPTTATNQNVTWTSLNEDIVTVDNDGKVTAIAVGTTTITVTTEDGSHTASCNVTVTPSPCASQWETFPTAINGATLTNNDCTISSKNISVGSGQYFDIAAPANKYIERVVITLKAGSDSKKYACAFSTIANTFTPEDKSVSKTEQTDTWKPELGTEPTYFRVQRGTSNASTLTISKICVYLKDATPSATTPTIAGDLTADGDGYCKAADAPTWSLNVTNSTSMQWYKDGAAIDGETSATFKPAESGKYYFKAVNHVNGYRDAEAKTDEVEVIILPTVTFEASIAPTSKIVNDGETVELTCSTIGHRLTYQWQVKNGENWNNVDGAIESTYTTPELHDAAAYRCVVTSNCEDSPITTNEANITFTTQSTNVNLTVSVAGEEVNLVEETETYEINTLPYGTSIDATYTADATQTVEKSLETSGDATIIKIKVTAQAGNEMTYTITVNPVIADKKLNQVIMSNGFDAFIKDGVITCYYLDGTSVPTISSTQVSDGATFDPETRTLTGSSDGHAIVYTLNAQPVTPATAPKTITFNGTETWIKTGYDYDADKGWRFSKNKEEAGNNRVTEGKNRLYFYVKNCQTLRLTSATSKRTVKVYVDGDELAELIETVDADKVFAIPVNKEGAAVVAIVSNQTNGDGGFKAAELVAMNLTVENNAEVNVNATASYNNVTVQPNGKLNVNAALTVSENLVLQANENARPQIEIEGANNIIVNGSMSYEWTVTAGQDYPVSMPCNVDIAEVKYWAGSDWDANFTMMIAEYDGEHRATDGEADGVENETNWKYTTGDIFAANKGYIIRVTGGMTGSVKLSFPLDNLLNTNIVTVTNSVAVQENAIDPENAKVKDFDAGWNFVGNPFLAAAKASGLAGYITNDNGASYTLTENNVVPFTGMFVQVDNGTALTFTNSAADPVRAENQANTKVTVKIALDEADYLGLRIADTYTTAYELTHDLLKMFGSAQTMSIYTLEGNTRLAYNAMPNDAANAIPVGFSATAGEHTIALMNEPTLEHLYLTDHLTGIVTDLLSSDYTFTTDGDSMNETRFELSAVRAEAGTATTIYDAYLQGAGVQKVLLDGKVYIIRNGVWYDVMGQVVK